MSLLDKALGHVATARTFAGAFWPWLLGAFLAGAGVASVPTFYVTRAIYQRATLQAQKNLSDFTAQLAKNAAEAQVEARRLQGEADAAENARQAAILSAISAGWQRAADQARRDNQSLREAINAPQYDCLRIPYPADALRLLSRPGGSVPAGDHPDPGAAAPP